LQALSDGLTGLANRRCFDETIGREFQRTARNGRPLSLIMVDIDLFKTFNDQYGHLAGDACLRAIGAAMRDVLRRPGDIAARYGGEEFAILLPETDVAGAVQIVSDMQAVVRRLAIRQEAGPLGVVTLSAGVASWSPGSLTATSAWLVEAADGALYEAKALGRNTFTVHPNADIASPAFPIMHKNAA
jgi:diguanylate cyclase (GGDEF)-like protein